MAHLGMRMDLELKPQVQTNFGRTGYASVGPLAARRLGARRLHVTSSLAEESDWQSRGPQRRSVKTPV